MKIHFTFTAAFSFLMSFLLSAWVTYVNRAKRYILSKLDEGVCQCMACCVCGGFYGCPANSGIGFKVI